MLLLYRIIHSQSEAAISQIVREISFLTIKQKSSAERLKERVEVIVNKIRGVSDVAVKLTVLIFSACTEK